MGKPASGFGEFVVHLVEAEALWGPRIAGSPLVEAAVGARLTWSRHVQRLTDSGVRRGLLVGFLGTKFECGKKRDDSFVSFVTQNIASRLRVWQLVEITSGGTRQREETFG